MGTIGNWQSGATPSRRHPEYYGGDIPWLKTGDLNDGYIDSVPEFISKEGFNNSSVVLNPIGSVLIAMYGATIGKLGITNIDVTTNQACCACLPIYISNKFLFYFLMYQKEAFVNQASGGAQPNISKEKIVSTLFPVPALNEQKKIVLAIDNLLEHIDLIDDNKDELSSIVIASKSKILDLAIRGKLLPQNPDDEPASVLLERVRSEKENLIKQGKLKRDKKESIIYKGDDNSYYEKLSDGTVINIDDELPFEVPDTWQWSRLSSLCIKEIKRGKAPKYVEKSNTLVFAQKCNLKKGGIDYTLSQYLDETTISRYDESEYLQKYDTVINSTGTGTLGRVGFIDSLAEYPIVPDSHVTTIRISSEMNQFYVFAMLKSLQSILEKSGEGSTNQKELKPNTLQDIFVPVPPVEEQKKICKAVHSCFSLIKNIEDSIN